MMAKYDDEDENDENDGLDLLSLADFDGERGGGGELGCQGAGHQGGEESKTEHSKKIIKKKYLFLAVQDSSIGDIVSQSVTHLLVSATPVTLQ